MSQGSASAELPPLAPPAATTGLLEVFRKRYLLRMLVRNTIKSRYQGTALGWTWSYLQPAMRFAMFYFVFEVAIGRGGDDVRRARRTASFAGLPAGTAGLVLDSYGMLAVCLERRSAADELGLSTGTQVTLSPLDGPGLTAIPIDLRL